MKMIKNSRLRTLLRYLLPFLLMPLVIALGMIFLESKYHAIITVAVLLLSLLLFLCGFDRRMVGVRRQVIVAVMTALSVVGRFIPFFKPITAMTTITGMYLGGEAAFLVGALSAVISNFFYGQGPWTPFQMMAWGLIGLFSGFLAPLLRRPPSILSLQLIDTNDSANTPGAMSGIVSAMTTTKAMAFLNNFSVIFSFEF